MPSKAGDRGFSLIEVLVALVIVTLGLVALYNALGDHYLQISRSNARQSTLAYAQSHLETIGKSVEIAPGTVSGRYENGATWRLSMSAIATRASAGQPVAVPMLLVLEAFDGRGRQLLRLKTVKRMPVSRT